MTQPETVPQNVKTAKAVQKQTGNRFSTVYWENRVYRPTYTRNGQRFEVAQFFVQIAHGGRRHAVALATNSLDEAARRAVKLFKALKQSGWYAALRLFRPDAEPTNKALTIGRYLALVDDYAPLPSRTFANYSYALRRIASDIAGAKLKAGENRYDPNGKWRGLTDDIPLSKITPVGVEDWRIRFLKTRQSDHISAQRAVRSANSYLRNARALFSRRILESMHKHSVALPDPLPFSGVRLDRKAGSTRYRSEIDPGKLLLAARLELAESDPDAYIAILLALGAGLRRSEIDALQRQNVIAEKGIIRVMTTAQRRVKSEESEGDVYADRGLFAELERVQKNGRTLYVVEPDTEWPKSKAAQVYRCSGTFSRVTAWLRTQGVMTNKPLHALRKEFGSVVAAAGDIHQAQRQLRHAQISTTEQFYADARKRATMPVTSFLTKSGDAK